MRLAIIHTASAVRGLSVTSGSRIRCVCGRFRFSCPVRYEVLLPDGRGGGIQRAAGRKRAGRGQKDAEVLRVAIVDRVAPENGLPREDGGADRHQQHASQALQRGPQQLPQPASHFFGLKSRTAMTTARPIRNHFVLPVRT